MGLHKYHKKATRFTYPKVNRRVSVWRKPRRKKQTYKWEFTNLWEGHTGGSHHSPDRPAPPKEDKPRRPRRPTRPPVRTPQDRDIDRRKREKKYKTTPKIPARDRYYKYPKSKPPRKRKPFTWGKLPTHDTRKRIDYNKPHTPRRPVGKKPKPRGRGKYYRGKDGKFRKRKKKSPFPKTPFGIPWWVWAGIPK